MSRFTCIILVLAGMAISPLTFAWSAEGHRLVCRLAVDRLSDRAREFVAETLALGEFLDGNTENNLPEACLWADKSRYNDYKGSYEQHFINIPKASDSINFGRDCAAMDCIAVGIQRSLTYLAKDPSGNREKARKAAALRFLGHFVGDLHQPLHVSNAEDWGGNLINISWFGAQANLHAVWDTKIIERAGISYPGSIDFLKTVPVDPSARNVLDWMKESFKLARSHAYPNVNGKPVNNGDRLDQAYFERAKPVVIKQLANAGERLAYLIESLAAGTLDTNILIE